MGPRVLLLALVLAPALACPGRAAAATTGAYEQATGLAQQARARRANGATREALGLYRQAHAVFPSPLLLWPIAELCLEANQPQEGLEALRGYREGVAERDRPQGEQGPDIEALEKRLLLAAAPPTPVPAKVTAPAPAPARATSPAMALDRRATERPAKRPLYRKAWLWGVVGAVVAAGIVTGVVVGTLPRSPDLSDIPAGNQRRVQF